MFARSCYLQGTDNVFTSVSEIRFFRSWFTQDHIFFYLKLLFLFCLWFINSKFSFLFKWNVEFFIFFFALYYNDLTRWIRGIELIMRLTFIATWFLTKILQVSNIWTVLSQTILILQLMLLKFWQAFVSFYYSTKVGNIASYLKK